jgi:hypothetical protein
MTNTGGEFKPDWEVASDDTAELMRRKANELVSFPCTGLCHLSGEARIRVMYQISFFYCIMY